MMMNIWNFSPPARRRGRSKCTNKVLFLYSYCDSAISSAQHLSDLYLQQRLLLTGVLKGKVN